MIKKARLRRVFLFPRAKKSHPFFWMGKDSQEDWKKGLVCCASRPGRHQICELWRCPCASPAGWHFFPIKDAVHRSRCPAMWSAPADPPFLVPGATRPSVLAVAGLRSHIGRCATGAQNKGAELTDNLQEGLRMQRVQGSRSADGFQFPAERFNAGGWRSAECGEQGFPAALVDRERLAVMSERTVGEH